MAKNYQVVDRYLGYRSLPDIEAEDPRYLVTGSQNVLINDQDKVETREGFTITGPTNTAIKAIESSFDWDTQRGGAKYLRSYDDELEARFTDSSGNVTWERIADGWSNVDFSFAKWWDATEILEVLIFVVGDSNIYEWSGGMAEIASTTSDTITKTGTTTWAQEGFYTSANKTVVINGTEYTYTGGENTTTLTGVTADPTGEANGSVVIQKIITNSNKPSATAQNDAVAVLENHAYYLDGTRNTVEVSKNTDYQDFTTPSAPRIPGEAAQLIIDSPGVGLAPLQSKMIVFAGKGDVYRVDFEELEVGTVLAETANVRKLKTGPRQSAFSRDTIADIGTAIVYLSNEKAVRILESAEDLENPLLSNLSIPIKPDIDASNFTNAHMKFNDNRVYLTAPNDSNVFILEFREDEDGNKRRFWQPPQVLPAQRFAIIDDVTHFHSNANPETYKLFDGTSDNVNGNSLPMEAIAKFPARSYDVRALLKEMDEYYIEGAIGTNTKITLNLLYDFDGATQNLEEIVDGSDQSILFEPVFSSSLGQQPLGQQPLGGARTPASNQPRFRVLFEEGTEPFFTLQPVFSSNDVDQVWAILGHGANVRVSPQQPTDIKQ